MVAPKVLQIVGLAISCFCVVAFIVGCAATWGGVVSKANSKTGTMISLWEAQSYVDGSTFGPVVKLDEDYCKVDETLNTPICPRLKAARAFVIIATLVSVVAAACHVLLFLQKAPAAVKYFPIVVAVNAVAGFCGLLAFAIGWSAFSDSYNKNLPALSRSFADLAGGGGLALTIIGWLFSWIAAAVSFLLKGKEGGATEGGSAPAAVAPASAV